MVNSKITTMGVCLILALGFSACNPSFVIQNVNYAQPVESVVQPDENNMVSDPRYAISFDIGPLLEEESLTEVEEVHTIRNREGYYFVTAPGFSSVFVLEPSAGELVVVETVMIPGDGLDEPAFNQRNDYIELVDLTSQTTYRLNKDGIAEEAEL